MPTITLLEQQKRDSERVNVYLDGVFAFGLNVMDAVQLRKGQQLTDAEITLLRAKDQVVRAVDQGITLLSYRPRSAAEIRQKLAKKDIPPDVIDAAIDRLQGMGYLDDRAFARFWIENRTRFKPRGKTALRHELRQKGVANSLIDELVNDLIDEDDAAYQAALPRVRRMRGKTQQEFKQKIGGFLQRRGFSYSVANAAIQQLITTLLADDPDYFTGEDA